MVGRAKSKSASRGPDVAGARDGDHGEVEASRPAAAESPHTRLGSPQGSRAAGSSDPGSSVSAKNGKGVPPPEEPEIVSAADLGQLFDLSERSIREYRARGVVVRAGKGYDHRRSVVGMIDHLRVEALRRYLGGVWLVRELEACLEYRRQVCDERDRLHALLFRIQAVPDLPKAVRAILADFPQERT